MTFRFLGGFALRLCLEQNSRVYRLMLALSDKVGIVVNWLKSRKVPGDLPLLWVGKISREDIVMYLILLWKLGVGIGVRREEDTGVSKDCN